MYNYKHKHNDYFIIQDQYAKCKLDIRYPQSKLRFSTPGKNVVRVLLLVCTYTHCASPIILDALDIQSIVNTMLR